MKVFVFAVLSYLIGAIPFAYLGTMLIKREDLRKKGTGNIGVTNAFKIGGTAAGVITLAGELLKAFSALFFGKYFFPENQTPTLLFLFCAFVGTNFSIFLQGKGGKGTTVLLWGMLVLSPYALAAILMLWGVTYKLSRGNIIVRRLWLPAVPLVLYLVEQDIMFVIFGLLYSILYFLKSLKTPDDFSHYRIFQKKDVTKK